MDDLEKKSGINCVVGLGPPEEEVVLDFYKRLFENQKNEDIEREKTPEEIEILTGILTKMPEFIALYGGQTIAPSLDLFHIVDYSKLSKEDKERVFKMYEHIGAAYLIYQQQIYIISDEQDQRLKFAHHATHELIHLNNFSSLMRGKRDNYKPDANPSQFLTTRRIGFSIASRRDNRFHFFHNIDEAIVVELVKRFDRRYFEDIPPLQEEVRAREAAKASRLESNPEDEEMVDDVSSVWEGSEAPAGIPFREGDKIFHIETYTYPEERKKLKELIHDIFTAHTGKFRTEEDVFRIFVKASLTGKLLEIARLVEETYGKGSFHSLGEETGAIIEGI